MKHINVFGTGIDPLTGTYAMRAHTYGEVLLDSTEGTLVIQGHNGITQVYNWDRVLAYTESPMTEEEIRLVGEG